MGPAARGRGRRRDGGEPAASPAVAPPAPRGRRRARAAGRFVARAVRRVEALIAQRARVAGACADYIVEQAGTRAARAALRHVSRKGARAATRERDRAATRRVVERREPKACAQPRPMPKRNLASRSLRNSSRALPRAVSTEPSTAVAAAPVAARLGHVARRARTRRAPPRVVRRAQQLPQAPWRKAARGRAQLRLAARVEGRASR